MREKGPAPTSASLKRIAALAREAFLRHGYEQVTMVTLAQVCGLTRRALYYYYSGKDEALQSVIRLENEEALARGREAVDQALARKKANALDVVTAWMDARFGHTRRALSQSAFAKEINDSAFAVCADVMNEYSERSNREMSQILRELQKRKLLTLNKSGNEDFVAALLTDGARGINQARPSVPLDALNGRYRDMNAAILYGVSKR
jgi:AcrR family transcriptional regulator